STEKRKRMFAFSRRTARETLGIAEREGAAALVVRARSACPAKLQMTCLREGLFDSSKTSATKPSLRGALSSVLTSADSAFQLALEIALGGVSAKVQPLRL